MTPDQLAQLCPQCADGTGRYCARLRCLCGHPECPAYEFTTHRDVS